MLDQKTARELLDYDAETGILTWRARDIEWFASRWAWLVWNKRFAGKPATAAMSNGYRQIRVLGKSYLGHRVVWLWMTGDWPADQVDHVNHDRRDNRWGNLRAVTVAENAKNMSPLKTGIEDVCGVRWVPSRRRWVARIGRVNLGRFIDKQDAIAARHSAEKQFGFHENHGRVGPLKGY